MKKFADGFAHQKGAIFGFSDKSCRDTGPVLKIFNLDEEELNVLNIVQVHNLVEECNVRLFNYEICIKEKKIFEAVSWKLVLSKSNDLIFNPQANKLYKTFRKAAKELKKLKINWNLKMVELQEKGYSEKAVLNTKIDS